MSDRNSMVRKPAPGWLAWTIAGLAILFALGGLVVDRADGVTYGALLLIGIGVVLARRVGLDLHLRLIGWASVAIVFFAVISYRFGVQTDIGVREAGRFLRFWGFAPLVAAFLMLDARQRRWIWAAIPSGAFLCAIVAGWELVHNHGSARAEGQSFPILFGDLALMGAFFSVLTYLVLRRLFPRMALPLSLLGFLGGLAASFMSGTRGAWVAIPVFVFLVAWVSWRQSGVRRAVLVASVLILALGVAVLSPSDRVTSRFRQASHDVGSYLSGRSVVAGIKPHTGCLDDPRLLAEFIKHIHVYGKARTSLRVVEGRGYQVSGLGYSCSSRAAVQFRNESTERRAVAVALIRRGLLLRDIHHAPVIAVSGRGWVSAHVKGVKPVRFNTPKMVTLAVGRMHRSRLLEIGIAPGHAVTFIPIATEKGEYVFGYAETSVGLRLEMWRAAWKMFETHILLGVGTGGFRSAVASYVQTGEFAPAIAGFDHPHNEYLAQLASRGIVGLMSLLTVMVLVAFMGGRRMFSLDVEVAAAGACSLLLVVGYAIFGLTETIFTHSLAIVYFTFYSAFFLSVTSGRGGMESVSAASDPGSINQSDDLDDE